MSDADEVLKQAFAYSDAGQFVEAAQLLASILRARPNHPEAWHELGTMHLRSGRPQEARICYSRAAEASPGTYRYRFNLALLLLRDNQAAEAVPHFLKAADLASERRDATALDQIGGALREAGHLTDAAAVYRRSLAFRPEGKEAAAVQTRLGLVLQEAGQLDEALAAFEAALKITPPSPASPASPASPPSPKSAEAISNALLTLTYHDRFTPEEIYQRHVELAGRLVPKLPEGRREVFTAYPSPQPSPTRGEGARARIRIGYLSPDLCQHSVAFFIWPVIANHDREKFLVTCYADVEKPDLITKELERVSERWRPIFGKSDDEVARQIEADEIDILIDLAGHTRGNRMSLLARRPPYAPNAPYAPYAAPVQVNYLGYPNTTGLSTVDYRITDSIADPVESAADSLHSEKLIRLPSPSSFFCYLTPRDFPEVPPLAPAAERKTVTFLVATNFAKVRPASLELWAKVLQATGNSRLILQAKALDDPQIRAATAAFFAERGLRDRVEMRGWSHFPEFLEQVRQVDIALDTFPFNGHTASCNLLWMGIPLVTLAGKSHRSRMGASILTSLGLSELVAQSEAEYVRIAAALAGDLPRLTDLRTTMRERMLKSPIMDAKSFVRNLEAAYERMLGRDAG